MSGYDFSFQDLLNIGAKKVGIPGWLAFRWEAAGDDGIIEGAIPGGVYQSGPNKGRAKFSHPDTKQRQLVVVTKAEREAAAAAYEAETGNCWNCKGNAKEWAGWSAAEGVRYKPCVRCGATGKAPADNGLAR